jgi:hypothetical protein
MRSTPGTRTPSKCTAYCVSDAIVSCCVSVTPGALGSTRKRSTPSPERARTTSRCAALANGTCHFTPSSR